MNTVMNNLQHPFVIPLFEMYVIVFISLLIDSIVRMKRAGFEGGELCLAIFEMLVVLGIIYILPTEIDGLFDYKQYGYFIVPIMEEIPNTSLMKMLSFATIVFELCIFISIICKIFKKEAWHRKWEKERKEEMEQRIEREKIKALKWADSPNDYLFNNAFQSQKKEEESPFEGFEIIAHSNKKEETEETEEEKKVKWQNKEKERMQKQLEDSGRVSFNIDEILRNN